MHWPRDGFGGHLLGGPFEGGVAAAGAGSAVRDRAGQSVDERLGAAEGGRQADAAPRPRGATSLLIFGRFGGHETGSQLVFRVVVSPALREHGLWAVYSPLSLSWQEAYRSVRALNNTFFIISPQSNNCLPVCETSLRLYFKNSKRIAPPTPAEGWPPPRVRDVRAAVCVCVVCLYKKKTNKSSNRTRPIPNTSQVLAAQRCKLVDVGARLHRGPSV